MSIHVINSRINSRMVIQRHSSHLIILRFERDITKTIYYKGCTDTFLFGTMNEEQIFLTHFFTDLKNGKQDDSPCNILLVCLFYLYLDTFD